MGRELLHLYECNRQGNVLNIKTDSLWNTNGGHVVQLTDSKAYHFCNLYNLSIYDSSLNHIVTEVPEFYNSFINGSQMAIKNDNTYFTVGVNVVANNNVGVIPRADYEFLVSFYRVDADANDIDFGYIDLTGYACWSGGIDFLEPNVLCYGGIQNSDFSVGQYTPIDNWIIAKNFDYPDQTENWLFKYGGDANYLMRGLFLTPENECIIYSTLYDWHNTNRLERDILIIKIDSTGTLVNVNNREEQASEFIIYPNPGTNSISIKSERCNATFHLISLDGRLLLSEKIYKNKEVYTTEHLKAGIYIYTIVDDQERILNKGKWIKQ